MDNADAWLHDERGRTRRQLLSAVAGGALVSLSGCANLQNPFAETTITVPETPEPRFAKWVPASLPNSSAFIRYTSPSTTASQQAIAPLNGVTGRAEYIGFDMRDVEYAIAIASAAVLIVDDSVSLESVEADLNDFGYVQKTVYKDFRIYERQDDRNGILAVGEDEVLMVGHGRLRGDYQQRLQTVIETRYGTATALYNESDAFAVTADYLGSPDAGGDIFYAENQSRDEGEVLPIATGSALPATDDSVYLTRIATYHNNLTPQQKDEEQKKRADLTGPFENNAVTSTSAEDGIYTITTESRISREQAVSTASNLERVPHVTLGVNRTAEGVQLVHHGGDEIDTTNLTLEVDTSNREDETSSEVTAQFRRQHPTFAPGATFEVSLSNSDTDLWSVYVIFGSGPRSESLLAYDHPSPE